MVCEVNDIIMCEECLHNKYRVVVGQKMPYCNKGNFDIFMSTEYCEDFEHVDKYRNIPAGDDNEITS